MRRKSLHGKLLHTVLPSEQKLSSSGTDCQHGHFATVAGCDIQVDLSVMQPVLNLSGVHAFEAGSKVFDVHGFLSVVETILACLMDGVNSEQNFTEYTYRSQHSRYRQSRFRHHHHKNRFLRQC